MPKLVNAPLKIKLSSDFLLRVFEFTLLTKSSKLLNGPLVERSSTILSMSPVPTFLSAPSPKRIFPSSTLNRVTDLLISGGRLMKPSFLA